MALVTSKPLSPSMHPRRTRLGMVLLEKFMNFTSPSCRIALDHTMEGDPIEQSGRQEPEKPRRHRPETEYRRSILSLRWLVVILASYLTLFGHLYSTNFALLFAFVIVFAGTNIVLALIPESLFESQRIRTFVTITDVLFVGGTFYLL